MSLLPPSLQAILLSCRLSDLDIVADKDYIIHQALAFGGFAELQWLFHTYSKSEIIEVFGHHPAKTYRRPTFLFVKDLVLKVTTRLPEIRYVINTPRSSR